MLLHVARDVRFGIRGFRREPAFALAVIVVLALGIGANTAVFAVVNTVLLRPLPYPDPEQLVQLASHTPTGLQPMVSVAKFNVWRDHEDLFTAIAAYHASDPGVSLSGGDRPEHVNALHASSGYLTVLGAPVIAGRTFTADDDAPKGPPVVVLGESLWRRRFGANTSLVGQSVDISGVAHQVVGIVGRTFTPEPRADLWLPLRADRHAVDHADYLHVIARLRPGVRIETARRRIGDTTAPFARAFSFALAPRERFTVVGMHDVVVGNVRPVLTVLGGAVLCVLVIVCANVGALLISRGHRRRRDIATRVALGGMRGRVFAQLLTESLLLAAAGGAAGLLVGVAGVAALSGAAPESVFLSGLPLTLDWAVTGFAAAISVGTALLSGVAPALTGARTDLSAAFRETGSSADSGWSTGRLQPAFVVVQVALALVLLMATGSMIRTVDRLRTIDAGFTASNVALADMSLAGGRFDSTAGVADLIATVERQASDLPGVEAISASRGVPVDAGFTVPFTIDQRAQFASSAAHGFAVWRGVSAGYFDVYRIKLIRGRMFDRRLDSADGIPVVLINRAMASKYWQTNWPIGGRMHERLTIGRGAAPDLRDVTRLIVGIVEDVRDAGVHREAQPTVYVPIEQVPDGMTRRNNRLYPLTWAVRTSVDARRAASGIAAGLQAASGGMPAVRIRTMESVLEEPLTRILFVVTLLAVFAGVALLLAAVGLYGLMAAAVQQRTREFGIRVALGAAPGHVAGLVVMQGLRLAAFGAAIGTAAAFATSRVLASVLFGAAPWDPTLGAALAVLFAVVTAVAAFVPAWRAVRVSPVVALTS